MNRPALLDVLWPARHWGLIRQLAAREVQARHRGSWLGLGWVVATPLLMVAVYTLVLRHAMGVRWGGAVQAMPQDGWAGDLAFALRLYAGLAVFAFISEVLLRAPRLVADVPHLVKKVVFPLPVLPWVSVLAALPALGVAAGLLLLGSALSAGTLHAPVLALPLVWLPLLPLALGLAWGFAGIGTYVRDVGEVLGLAVGALMFLSPVFYELSSLPAALQGPLSLNPLAPVMTLTRQVLIEGAWPDAAAWAQHAGLLLLCTGVAVVGAWVFERVRPGFADVV